MLHKQSLSAITGGTQKFEDYVSEPVHAHSFFPACNIHVLKCARRISSCKIDFSGVSQKCINFSFNKVCKTELKLKKGSKKKLKLFLKFKAFYVPNGYFPAVAVFTKFNLE